MRVLFIHFRSAPARRITEKQASVDPLDSAGTDGVSLEMAKRRDLLEAMGHNVAVCSAYDWADFQIPALEFDSEAVVTMVRNLFDRGIADFASETKLRSAFNTSRLELKRQLAAVIEDFAPNMLFVHN
ncbi:MAG: hypothetical protein KAW13_02605, partial [Dehalococcoidia bacterium]|nr:hypothetical protein [Dehalococcoidia bacterium]